MIVKLGFVEAPKWHPRAVLGLVCPTRGLFAMNEVATEDIYSLSLCRFVGVWPILPTL